ncbi:MAG: DUF1501 domain-containing protein [Planctomycetaceae bacterium]|nr:DUF1501 domain-containing protein [Planctomycetaceae bacterium]
MAAIPQPSGIRLRLNRRDWLNSAAATAFGLPVLSNLTAASESPPIQRAKSLILIYLPGGLAQHESFDLKPDAPDAIRGEFRPIPTEIPGIDICEYLPQLALRARRFALLRTMSHKENNHFPATHKALTGHVMPLQLPGDAVNAASRNDWPSYAAAYDFLRPRADGVPNGVALPYPLAGGATLWPGQHAGFLATKHDPWQLNNDPNQKTYRDESLSFPAGVTIDRVSRRRNLLQQFEQERLPRLAAAEMGTYQGLHETAIDLLTSGRMARAFELEREPEHLRDAYGRHTFGQSLLLARRLVEAGVSIVQANMGGVQTWDTHDKNFVNLRESLLPPLDRGLSALLDDLASSGLLDETLIVMTGEFGRTPTISVPPGSVHAGRNHWAEVYTAFFAGGGVRGGQAIGRSDATGAHPITPSFSPDDLGTTLFDALGIPTHSELRDRFDRPLPLCSGKVIDELFTA